MNRRWMVSTAVLVGALAATGWTGLRVWQVKGDLVAANASAQRLKTAVVAERDDVARRELAALQRHSRAAEKRSDGLSWRALRLAPGLGDDATAVHTISRTLAELSTRGLPELLTTADDLQAGTLAPKDGVVPVDRVAALSAPVHAGADAFRSADKRLRGIVAGELVGPVRRPYEQLVTLVDRTDVQLTAVTRAVDLLPKMLGQAGERRYLLVFQNNAEARASGGMPGMVALLHANEGRVTQDEVVPAGAFPMLDKPVLPLSAEEKAVYGEQLGTYFQDANFTPDFPRTAELMAARWQRDRPGRIDGVISVDPVALSYLLRATGPVTVDGVRLSSDTVVDELLNRTYLRLPDPKDQDTFFAKAAASIFEAFSTGVGSPRALVGELARGVGQRRLLVHSFDQAEQRSLSGTPIAGELPRGQSDRPQVGLYLNDSTGSKMSYYLRYRTQVLSMSCRNRVQELNGELVASSQTPPGVATIGASITGSGAYGVPKGSQLVSLDLVGPVGGTLSQIELDGEPMDVEVRTVHGRPDATLALWFDPGQELTLSWQMTTGRGQTGRAEIHSTPGVVSGGRSSGLGACG